MATMLGDEYDMFSRRCVWVNGPIIVGAGPSGLAVGASLKEHGVPFVVLERADCIASLWQKRTYDRLKLHLPKQFCQLPNLPFPDHYPEYPTRRQFIDYLDSYAERFELRPRFNQSVECARYDETCGLWRVKTVGAGAEAGNRGTETEYIGRWLVVATGENAEKVVPELEGLGEFGGDVTHVCDYKSGQAYAGKRVLVVGCGNSGMEACLDLCDHNADPSMVVRDSVHARLTPGGPRQINVRAGRSPDDMAAALAGGQDHAAVGVVGVGPLEFKNTHGRIPVLDIGALSRIRSGDIKVVPGVRRFWAKCVELVDGRLLYVDSVILATGYRSNVPQWLQGCDFFTKGFIPQWVESVGFTRRGLAGASFDAVREAEDISKRCGKKKQSRQEQDSLVARGDAYLRFNHQIHHLLFHFMPVQI